MSDDVKRIHNFENVSELKIFLMQNESIVDSNETLSEYLGILCNKYQISKKDVIRNALIDTVYGYQIFEGRRKPKRRKMIQLAFGFPLQYAELQHCLYLCESNLLVSHIKEDAVIIYACSHQYDLSQLNDLLYELGKDEYC